MDPNIAQTAQPTTPLAQTPVPQATEPIQPIPNTSSGKVKYLFLAILILLVLVVLGGGAYYLGIVKQQPFVQKNNNTATTQIPTPTTASTPASTAQSTPTPDPTANWKTYTNPKYNFSIKYPPTSQLINNSGALVNNGSCGNAIKEDAPVLDYTYSLTVDNFFDIWVKPWNGTIMSYIQQQNAQNYYNVHQITNSGADEAVWIESNNTYNAGGFPPLAYVRNIYKKNNNLFFLRLPQNDGNYNGCIAQGETLNQIISTFKFIDQNQTSCNTDSDCQNGAKCMTVGPIIANQPVHKVCVQQGQAVPQ